mmetsp:Transcript_109321/g.308509  ORF Transcript_109321/g.308509 Transcript_109321/m.308509 type:complete len:635 (-) Transcript_109321:233-2137(-)|eukprot:CAMPEP_0117485990 /NCGR_PEP_ID=MMETSP0784-20121206/15246_1 /TAXON_ID=39447 /ORGANISM="" /LENGTH=634 /DNA_ID=CAMNT_0005280587 /DNA_START=66 /DNA_END=1970 /DNA_ORIENTATION=+
MACSAQNVIEQDTPRAKAAVPARCVDVGGAQQGGPPKQRPSLGLEVLCGVTVALAQLPEAVAFSLAAGLPPAIGLNSACIIGLVTAVLGGRPAMICGATGSLSVVVGGVVRERGVEYFFFAVFLMGVIQILLGALRVGTSLKLVPVPVLMGFCNGLALAIGLAQLSNYKVRSLSSDSRRLSGSFSAFTDGVPFVVGFEAVYAGSLTVIALLICMLLPKLTTRVPSALVAVVFSTAFEWAVVRAAFGGQTMLVGDIASVGGSLPSLAWLDNKYHMPPLNVDTLRTVLPLSFTMAAIGLIESLVTLNLIDEITKTKSSKVRECVGQGVANMLCGAFGGMGGCAMIGQSMINIKSGARSRVSSTCAALFLLVTVIMAYPAIDIVPVSALVGVMFAVAIHTFEWSSLRLMAVATMPKPLRDRCLGSDIGRCKIRRIDAFLIFLVTIVTLFSDLASAVACGVVVSCCTFAYDAAKHVSATARVDEDVESGRRVKLYDVQGVLFFGSSGRFLELFDVENDPADVRLVFESGYISDFTAIDALNKLGERYGALGKRVSLQLLQPGSIRLVGEAGGLLMKEIALVPAGDRLLPARPHHFNFEGEADVSGPLHALRESEDESTEAASQETPLEAISEATATPV